jgi:hypothetical protein
MVTNNVSSAIVDADALDLDLRMSQPHAPESKRGNIMAGLQLPFPESSSAMVNQVRKLQHLNSGGYIAVRDSFVCAPARVSVEILMIRAKYIKLTIFVPPFDIAVANELIFPVGCAST